jgi:uncharacterized protein YbjT (DUF2867 family)
MKVLLFGASGMVGRSVLLACLDDPRVTLVVAVLRRPTGVAHPKLEERIHGDFSDYSSLEPDFADVDACFFCLGVSAAGMSEPDYRHITYDYTLAAAGTLAGRSPQATFCYVSGAGTDSAEKSIMMWARVKGRTENDLLKLPFRAVYLFRPGWIQPIGDVKSRTTLYRISYSLFGVLYPLLHAIAPKQLTTTTTFGRAMIGAVAEGGPSRVIGTAEINRLGA